MKKLIITESEKREIRKKYGLCESLPELETFPIKGNEYNIGWDQDWDNFSNPMGTANTDFSKTPTYAGVGGHMKGHWGVDIFGKRGTPVLAPVDGIAKHNNSNGNTVIIEDPKTGYSHWLGHLDSRTIEDGEFVNAGDEVGTLGDSGNAKGTAPHVHYNIYKTSGGFYTGEDPIDVLKKSIGKSPKSDEGESGGFYNWVTKTFKNIFGNKDKDGIAKVEAEDEGDLFTKLKGAGNMFFDYLKNIV
jgi:murein DD-endopeptidase MepM/ murein hydrolase activator NlpD